MSERICVSAVFGAYDLPKLPPPGVDRAILFTDQDPGEYDQRGWEVRRRTNLAIDDRYLSKAPKCAPFILGIKEEEVLWIDGSLLTTGLDVDMLFDQVPYGKVGAYRHRWNEHIRDEANASKDLPRYVGQPIREQCRHYYETTFHGRYSKVWETGILVWRAAQYKIGAAWLAEQLAWTNQDQLSFPLFEDYVHDLSPGNVIDNPWFKYVDHLKCDWK